MPSVRLAGRSDTAVLARFRHALWPDGPEAEHRAEVERFFEKRAPAAAVMLAEDASGPLGFAELSIRPYAEGCDTDRVGFLEGWYVRPEARRRGVGRELVAAGLAWARAQGCTEFASDSEADNALGAAAHRALGFEEVGLIRCFRKTL